MKPPHFPPENPVKTYQLGLPVQGKTDVLSGALFSLLITTVASVGLYYLVRWLPWLFWPVIALSIFWIHGSLGVIGELRRYFSRSDTATSTIRGAAQGDVEILGKVKAIPGHELTSPAIQVPCVRYKTRVSRSANGSVKPFFFKEDATRAFLIDDGTGEVFAPRLANSFNGLLLQTFKTIRRLPEKLQDRLLSSSEYQGLDLPRGPYEVDESVMPVGINVQANATFVTINASDSYIRAWKGLNNNRDLQLSESEIERIESDWRAYADTFLSPTNGSSDPAPLVNALLPARGDNTFTLQYRPHKKNYVALDTITIQLVMSIAPIILVLILFGWLSPQDLWPWR